jgi:hypothetical protein
MNDKEKIDKALKEIDELIKHYERRYLIMNFMWGLKCLKTLEKLLEKTIKI